ncbi:DUF2127 domain-containing protein [Stenomitos frigidus]|uniref:DUF2127 domain-containing protein n=1 Tax=Stenomitos frigidus ULC18 TaxID=2107698 RepID=A0A2T1DW92_9CYAN|nr:DUF2127 domain-containing protein [Stenomitos frigidus]PSB24773.1 DUF2127 domain-containing protein [Stenomitos frigidus ULC18]
MLTKRSFGLLAIVFYKSFVASLLAVTSVALLLALRNYDSLADFSESYTIEGKTQLIDWVLDKILNLNPRTLEFSGIGAGVYALLTAIEAIGLWHEKRWAHVLVLVLVGLSIPPEVYELIHGVTLIKAIVFVVNIVVFWYLFSHFPKHKVPKQ